MELADIFSDLPGLDLKVCSANSGVIMDGRLEAAIPVPFQRNLNWLPLNVRMRLLFEAVADRRSNVIAPTCYAEYAMARCGKGVYDLFLRSYESKRLRFNLDDIPPDWTSRIEKTRLSSLVVPKALSNRFGAKSGESRFVYPRSGGIEAVPRAMAKLLPPNTATYGRELTAIHPLSRTVSFADGTKIGYEHLVLGIPLPETISLIRDPPPEVLRAGEDLIYSSIYVVSFGFEGAAPSWSLLRVPTPNWAFTGYPFRPTTLPEPRPKGIAP